MSRPGKLSGRGMPASAPSACRSRHDRGRRCAGICALRRPRSAACRDGGRRSRRRGPCPACRGSAAAGCRSRHARPPCWARAASAEGAITCGSRSNSFAFSRGEAGRIGIGRGGHGGDAVARASARRWRRSRGRARAGPRSAAGGSACPWPRNCVRARRKASAMLEAVWPGGDETLQRRHEQAPRHARRAGWRRLPSEPGVRPYTEKAPIAAFFVGISSGFPYAMIGATLTTRLAQDGITKSTVTTFALAFLVYNLKFLWAWIVDGVRIPVLGRLGQRVSWLLVAGAAGHRGGRQPRLPGPVGQHLPDRDRRDPGRRRRRHLRHRHRRLPDRIARAAPARRRLRHVAIWLADRLGRGRRAGAGAGGPGRLGDRPISPAPSSRCRRC